MDYQIIKDLCSEKGIFLEMLAEKIGMSRSGMSTTFKNGTLKVETLERIAEVLEVSPSYFFEGKKEEGKMKKLKSLLKNRSIEFDLNSFLSLLFWNHFEQIAEMLIDFAQTNLSAEEINLLLKKFEDFEFGANDDDFFYDIEKEKGLSEHVLCTKYILLFDSRVSSIKSVKNKKAISNLQILVFDKFLGLVQNNQELTFLIEEDLLSTITLNVTVQNFLLKYLKVGDVFRLLKNKEIQIDSVLYTGLNDFFGAETEQ